MEVKNKFEIFGLSETHLHGEVLDSELRMDGYVFERSDRQTCFGGGVRCCLETILGIIDGETWKERGLKTYGLKLLDRTNA